MCPLWNRFEVFVLMLKNMLLLSDCYTVTPCSESCHVIKECQNRKTPSSLSSVLSRGDDPESSPISNEEILKTGKISLLKNRSLKKRCDVINL